MARDLIPPPSPAGRPPPDPPSEPAATQHLEEATRLTAQADPALRQPAPFRGRFGFLFGVLAGIAVCAAALGAVLIVSPGEDDGPQLAENWSSWKPSTTDMVAGAADIAAHVAFRYKLDDGNQLVQVRSSELEYQGSPLGVAVRPRGGDLRYLEGDGLLYQLEGSGPNSSVPGTPTAARGQLVLREALELALYSFRYLDDVTMVAVLLPPEAPSATGTTSSATRAVFFRPGDLLSRLQVPLTATLPGDPPAPKALSKAERARIDDLTLGNLFLATLQPLRDNQTYLVLQEPDSIS